MAETRRVARRDGTPVPEDSKYHVDPVNPMVMIRYLEPWYPPGVTEFFSGGNTARLGLLPDGTLLKYVRDRKDRDALYSLNVEHSILSALGQHDRIVKYLGKHEHGILLQRALNGDIYSYISKHEHDNISLQLRQKWTTQAAEALVFIHSKGVIHCDIHPNNFLLDDQLNVQLCDFAGSLFGSLDGGAMESTRFFLPRDWRDPPNIKSDLFAFGSVIYYIMTGREPYVDLSDDEVMAKFEQKEFPNVEVLKCGSAIKGCWTGDFGSAEDVLKAILEDSLVET
ncbi:kinase-like protein [Trematosphaeria pertusa]|uniref:Kinase-like protein n=1 Tax=Trematosphaeria pertusa TaxID=390896 RepID=A0A6A6HRJ6_9PLEO|nr:kinase-like protein [Trematosphaeria pertusa]KAF2240428.1 kinase-like protein [Trematosphaeria pertusa]